MNVYVALVLELQGLTGEATDDIFYRKIVGVFSDSKSAWYACSEYIESVKEKGFDISLYCSEVTAHQLQVSEHNPI